MGSQRYIAEDLMIHYKVTTKRAYEISQLYEAVAFSGDDLADAAHALLEGDRGKALAGLDEFVAGLQRRIAQLAEATAPLEVRDE